MKLDKKQLQRIYMMGICGTGMAALAGLLQEKGFEIAGSDAGCYEPMSGVLKRLKIDVFTGYKPENIKRFQPDLVIVGNVISKDNPEAQFLLNSNIPYMSFPEAMGHFFLSKKKSLVVTGTHGKTTTSTLLLSALEACGVRPGFMIGGVPIDKERGFGIGRDEWFVIEGDEYDTSFFQKVSKFLFYRPFGAIMTSIEFDHADIFQSLDEIISSFSKFAGLIPKDGVLVACMDWDTVMKAASNASCKLVTYGMHKDAEWRLGTVDIGETVTVFEAIGPHSQSFEVKINLPGIHNALNALSVLALCSNLGFNANDVIEGLAKCRGVKRRQEIRGIINDIIVIDDFAHHPRAVKETLKALKERFAKRRIIAVFEPRTNTSMRAVFQDYYVSSFDHADKIYVRDVPHPEKVPEDNRFSSKELVRRLVERGKEALFCKDATQIISEIQKDLKPGNVYVILSNGPFEQIHQRLLDSIKTTSQNKVA